MGHQETISTPNERRLRMKLAFTRGAKRENRLKRDKLTRFCEFTQSYLQKSEAKDRYSFSARKPKAHYQHNSMPFL